MKFANTTKFDRKSGVARRDLQFALLEKRNQDAIRSRQFRSARKRNCRSLRYAPVPRQAGTGGVTILWEN